MPETNPTFIDRINNPQDYGFIRNPDSSISTHRMAAEIDEMGNVYAFPMIVQTAEGLHEFTDPFQALEWNKQQGNVKQFGTIEEADEYARGGYKTDEFKQYYNSLPTVVEIGDTEIEFPDYMTANEISSVIFQNSQPGQILHSLMNPQMLEPFREPVREVALDVLPGTAQVRSVDRIQQMVDSFKSKSPIGKVLTGADLTLEGAGLAADVVPALKGIGAAVGAGASLIPMMARQGGNLSPLQQALRNQLGLIGYHGSPHRFDRFDLSKIGTGEGAQAYGHGIYVAETSDVAKSYVPRDFDAEDEIMALYKGAEAREDYLKMEMYERALMHDTPDEILEIYTKANGYGDDYIRAAEEAAYTLRRIDSKVGNLYQVDLPDEKIAQMLDWDAPVEHYDPLARQLIDDFPDEIDDIADITGAPGTGYEGQPEDGRAIYQWLSAKLGGDDAASAYLRESGIPGIKYWDGGSRAAGSGTRNFVVFDADDLTILKRNDELLPQYQPGFYHGSDEIFETFEPAKQRQSSTIGHYFTGGPNADPDAAYYVASGYGKNVGEYELNLGKSFDLTEIGPHNYDEIRAVWKDYVDEPADFVETMDYDIDGLLNAAAPEDRGKIQAFIDKQPDDVYWWELDDDDIPDYVTRALENKGFDDWVEKISSPAGYNEEMGPGFRDYVFQYLRGQGYDSVSLWDDAPGGGVAVSTVVFDPKNIRKVE